ncbi:hypothetical protein [Thermomonospora echinospora]|nr:hypothetical protein [Thermomonospora echinospora]
MYEMVGWLPEELPEGVRRWVGDRVWLVPVDEALGPWLLEDAVVRRRQVRLTYSGRERVVAIATSTHRNDDYSALLFTWSHGPELRAYLAANRIL